MNIKVIVLSALLFSLCLLTLSCTRQGGTGEHKEHGGHEHAGQSMP